MLRAVGIHKAYGPRAVLQGVTLNIAPGDRVGVVGMNGAGKSTLLRILAGEPPDAGEVERLPGVCVALLPQELPILEGTLWEAALAGAEELLRLRGEWTALSETLARAPDDGTLLGRIGEIQDLLERRGGFDLEVRARRVLHGLGLPDAVRDRPVAVLSGGERTRLSLSRILLLEPDLLLLDEPTNHLDIAAIEWLEGFLRGFRGALVVTSHDRRFLNVAATRIVELQDGLAREYRGNYDAYRRARERELRSQEAAWVQHQEELGRLREFVRRQEGRARQISRGPKRGRDHYGRVAKKVARRARAAEQRIARLETDAPDRPRDPDRVTLHLTGAERIGPVVAQLRGVEKRFGERVLFRGLDLTLRRGDRVGLVGPNGSGKTTLLRMLAGREPPTAGQLWRGPGVAAGVLSQHADELDPAARPIDVALDAGLDPSEARALLAALLFRGDRVLDPVAHLSGGERTRLALLQLAHRANLLLLDEPTNHLDLTSRERFEEALDGYEGTMVLASHDRFLLDRLCAQLWVIVNGRVQVYEGSYADYVTRPSIGHAPKR